MGLHEASPDDPEINLELGRLAAHRQDVQAALRFYQNALYAPWPPERVDTRRSVRFELIRFLLAQGQTDRATAELLAVSTDLPDKAETHLQVAQLFADAGDNRHAFDHFQHAVRLDPDNGAALAGAGRVAYQLGRLLAARSYLRRAPADLDDVAETREIVELAISHDPLANRIGAAERRRRLSANVGYERQRLEGCLAQHGPAVRDRASDEKAALQVEVQVLDGQLQRASTLDQDTLEAGVDLVDRVARQVVVSCLPPTPLDRALVLIGHQHGGEVK